jgi:hypothetical protein
MFNQKKALILIKYWLPVIVGVSIWLYLAIDSYQNKIAEELYETNWWSLVIWNYGVQMFLVTIFLILLFQIIFLVSEMQISKFFLIAPILGVILSISLVKNHGNAVVIFGLTGIFSMTAFWAVISLTTLLIFLLLAKYLNGTPR